MPALKKPAYERIAQELANGKIPKLAYVSAGYTYSPKSCNRIVTRPEIVARVQELIEEKTEFERKSAQLAMQRLTIDKFWVMERLKHIVDNALKPRVIREATESKPAIYGRPDYSAANRSLELIGREFGMFVERHEVGEAGAFARMTDAELHAKIIEDAQALGIDGEALEVLQLTFQPGKTDEAAE